MKNIVIVGVGALGSHVVQFIRNLNVNINIIDYDHLERKNTMSQFHAKTNVGKNKTLSIQQTMNFLFGIKINVNSNKLVEGNVKQLLEGTQGKTDLIIDCLDNAAARQIVQNFVRANNIPCLHGALSAADNSFGRVVWDENFKIDVESPGVATCENGNELPFIAITSAYIAQAVKLFIETGNKSGYQISPGGSLKI